MNTLSRRGAMGLGLMAGSALAAAPARAKAGVAPVLPELSIAVPLHDNERPITIGPDRHFHVTLANRSEQPLRLWSDHCSEGEDNLGFQVSEGGVVKTIRRNSQEWAKNFPIVVTLAPGDLYALEISFNPSEWNLPWPASEIGKRRVRMRAFYEIRATEVAKEKRVWTGKVASKYDGYTLTDNRH